MTLLFLARLPRLKLPKTPFKDIQFNRAQLRLRGSNS
jgi:hypothetical protein